MNYHIKIAKSNISGFGVIVTKNISIGETICFMEGEEISLLEAGRRGQIDKSLRFNGILLQS